MRLLWFVVLLTLCSGNVPAANVVLLRNDKPAVEVHTECTPFKPYVAQLYSPGGVAVLRDNVADHLHHHGLMFAVAVNDVNFWEERTNSGHQVQRQLQLGDGAVTQELDWIAPGDKTLLRERRVIRIHRDEEIPATLLTWRSRLQSKDEVRLTGHHYFGLGMRFAADMDKIGAFINSDNVTGDVVRGDERLTAAKWCAYTDRRVTVALFDHPGNLRHPARMFTMAKPFAYLSATLNLWKEPFALRPDKPLELQYGVAVWDGEQTPEQIEKLYSRWLEKTK